MHLFNLIFHLKTYFFGFVLALTLSVAWAGSEQCLTENSNFISKNGSEGCWLNDGKYGHPVGIWKVYNQHHEVIEELSYDLSGKLQGRQRLFFEGSDKNQIKEKRFYQSGVPNGVWVYWYPNGEVREEREYVSGELHGLRKRWTSDGAPDGVECYIHGKRKSVSECSSRGFESRHLAQE